MVSIWHIRRIFIWETCIRRESHRNSRRARIPASLLTVTFAVEIYPRSVKETTRMNISCGFPTTQLLIWKMDIELGFTFLSMGFPKVNSSLLLLKIWMSNQSCMVKVSSLFSECYQTLRKNGGEYSQRSIIFSTVMNNSSWNSSTCSVISPTRRHFSHFLTLLVTKSPRPKLTQFRDSSRQPDQKRIYTSTEKPYIIL